MGKDVKSYSKKEKAAAIMVGTALVAAPFLFDSTQVDAETISTPPPTEAPTPTFYASNDKLGDTFVPQSGNIDILDLNLIYKKNIYDYPSFTVTSSNDAIAFNEPGYDSSGLLKIHPVSSGTATFTVIINSCEIDTFHVTVDPSISVERKFDINDAVKKITTSPNEYALPADVGLLLSNIGPMKPPGTKLGNHAPELLPDQIHDYNLEEGQLVHLYDSLSTYFNDSDEDMVSVDVIQIHDDQQTGYPAAYLENLAEGATDYWVLNAYRPGVSKFAIVARDGNGGVTESQPFTVNVYPKQPPFPNVDNSIVNHLLQQGNKLNLSSSSELDLSEIFYDAIDGTNLTYAVDVNYGCGNVTTLNMPASILSFSNIAQISGNPGPFTVTNLKATDKDNLPVNFSVNIKLETAQNDFNKKMTPTFNMYESNEAGVSDYTIDPAKYFFDSGKSLVGIQQHHEENESVTASVYQSNKIKFVAGTSPALSSRIKLLSSTSGGQEWFQNDIVFNLIEPEITSGTIKVNLNTLYPYFLGTDWDNFTTNFSSNVLVSSTASVAPYYSGSYVITIDDIQNTSTVLTIDPDANKANSGSRTFTIPILRPNN
ncbi:hypothetical protein [Paenibacillus qinlingensis]|uniref:Uncharacterized protein n=1 Tax=Paenibacillus qinlingensis TaxID=1837343 RepID=A0ABU1NN93_9BACL|nr:hypothetical protein [Paenibacillus qinlingensis]MDR6548951.1 hypothetical protein [Paenibacillus qinlingensis]